MWRPLAGIRVSKVNTALLMAGVALLLVALLSRWVTIGSNQIARDAPWWVAALVGVAGVLAIAWALAASREQLPALRTVPGFLGAPPKMPDPQRLVGRPDLSHRLAAALRAGGGPVALTGIGGAGKSTLAAAACMDRRVQRRFRGGVTWLETAPGQDPVALLGDLGRRLGLPDSESGFTTEAQGRDKIAAALVGRRMLIAVDNVWERGPLDAVTGLAPGCMVLFTTRLPSLAATFGATPVAVDELTPGQALELLGRWAGQVPARLPDAARALCTRVGNLALGVTMAGAMVAQGRPFTDVLDLIEQDLARVHADLDPAYQYRNLLAAIEAGVSDLPATGQRQYAQLAVFAGRGPFPREAAAALWRPGLEDGEVGDLLTELAGRSLLTAAGEGWYAAHDLQYDVLKRRLGSAGLAAAHARLLAGYRTSYPGGWADSATDRYLSSALAGHLRDADCDSELRALLTDVAWIQARLAAAQLPGLLADYGYASDPLSEQLARALRLSAHILAADPGQVRGQLAGRLLGHPDPAVVDWVTALTTQDGPGPWLAPLTQALTPTSSGLEQVLAGHDGPVYAVAVSADGSRVVSGGYDGRVRVWDLANGHEQGELTGLGWSVRAVAVNGDGTRAVSSVRGGTVRVWDLAARREQATLTGHSGEVRALALSGDGTRAVSGGEDGTVRVWDPATGREQATLTGHSGEVQAVALSGDGTRAVSSSEDGTVRVWDPATGREQATLTGHGSQRALALNGDGTRAVSGGWDGGVRVWDLATGREQATLTGHDGPVQAVALSGDGTRAVSGGGDGTVRVWDLATGREQARFTGHYDEVLAVAVTADGTRAFSGGRSGWDGGVRVWDLAARREQATLTGHTGEVWAMAASRDGTRAVSSGRDGTVRVWDLATGREQATLTGHDGEVRALALSGDGTRAVSGGFDGKEYMVRVWDPATGREQARFTGHDGPVRALALSGDGTWAVSGGWDGGVRVWDPATGREQATLTGHDGPVRALALSGDGTRAVSGGEDGTVRVWDLATGREQAALTGHDGEVLALAVTADGTRAVSSGGDGTVRVWDLATGREQAALTGPRGRQVVPVTVSDDGAMALSGDFDGTVRVWDVATEKEAARWTGDSAIVACAALPGQPLKIAVGQQRGQPYLLELRRQRKAT